MMLFKRTLRHVLLSWEMEEFEAAARSLAAARRELILKPFRLELARLEALARQAMRRQPSPEDARTFHRQLGDLLLQLESQG